MTYSPRSYAYLARAPQLVLLAARGLLAFVVTRPGKIVSAEELTDFLAEHIAAYKIPARIHFQHHLPLTASGKIAHQELQEPT